jgi:hypothetical protein
VTKISTDNVIANVAWLESGWLSSRRQLTFVKRQISQLKPMLGEIEFASSVDLDAGVARYEAEPNAEAWTALRQDVKQLLAELEVFGRAPLAVTPRPAPVVPEVQPVVERVAVPKPTAKSRRTGRPRPVKTA